MNKRQRKKRLKRATFLGWNARGATTAKLSIEHIKRMIAAINRESPK